MNMFVSAFPHRQLQNAKLADADVDATTVSSTLLSVVLVDRVRFRVRRDVGEQDVGERRSVVRCW